MGNVAYQGSESASRSYYSFFSFEDKCIMQCKDTNYFAFIIMNYKIYYFNYNILIL